MHALPTDCDLPQRAVERRDLEIRRWRRRLNDSGRIGDVRGESAMPQIPDESLHAANRREGPATDMFGYAWSASNDLEMDEVQTAG
jgi:hypothetical protein